MPTKLIADPRNAVRVWMRQVLAERQWTAAEWARQANTSATNITRMLNDSDASMPTAATLSKLAKVAGSQPNLSFTPNPGTLQLRELAVHREVALAKGADRTTATSKSIAVAQSTAASAIAVQVEGDWMNAGGILPGDTIVVDMAPIPAAKPPKDRIVVGVVRDGSVVMGRCHPPMLIPISTNPKRTAMPLASVRLVGVVTQLVRSL